MIEEVPKAAITVSNNFSNFDPPVSLVTIHDAPLKRGHFILELGIVDHIWNSKEDLTLVDEATPRDEPYVVQTRVTEECFPLLPKELQTNMLTQMEKRMNKLKELYEKFKDVEKVTLENLYGEDEVLDYWTKLGLGKTRPNPAHDPIRQAYCPPAAQGHQKMISSPLKDEVA